MNRLKHLWPFRCAAMVAPRKGSPLLLIKVVLVAGVLMVAASGVKAQQNVLTLSEVLDIVKKYHPVARQADLIVDSAEANRLAARGSFDPTFYINNQQKHFSGTRYYFYTNPELKIPTWYGLDLKAGLENNGGERLNPEATKGQMSYVGISLPLLKNLLTDKRRTTLQQAQIIVRQSEATRLNEINNLLYDAAAAYWNWAREYQVYKVILNVIDINQARLTLVQRAFLGGDRAAIDTVEALTQLQNFQSLAAEAQYRWIAAGLELSNYLWLDNNQPFDLTTRIIPDTTWNQLDMSTYIVPDVNEALATARLEHPKIRTLNQKLEVLEAERRLKFQSLLPTFNFNYNFLSKGYEPWKGVGGTMFENNYKYGFELGIPLLLRQGRGEYRGAKIKIEATSLQRQQTGLEIENKIKDYYNQALALRTQVGIYERAYQNYLTLLRAEEIKFSIGESSLFLLNSRENKVLEARQKLLELKTKFFKALVAVEWAAGRLQ